MYVHMKMGLTNNQRFSIFFGSKNMNVDDDDNHNNDTVQIRNHKCNPEKCEDGTPK